MLSKIKTIVVPYLNTHLRDVRFVGLIAFGVLVLLTSWSGVKIIEVNYELQKEIAALEARNEVGKLENENAKLKNQYLNTDTYVELTARQQLGKGAKGETLILVPKEIALARAPELVKADERPEVVDNAPEHIKNLRAWRSFYLGSN